jgi:hypothetical protein
MHLKEQTLLQDAAILRLFGIAPLPCHGSFLVLRVPDAKYTTLETKARHHFPLDPR